MSQRSKPTGLEDQGIGTRCPTCKRMVVKVVSPGEREIEVYQDTDVRWRMSGDLKGDRWMVTPVHCHEEHKCGGEG